MQLRQMYSYTLVNGLSVSEVYVDVDMIHNWNIIYAKYILFDNVMNISNLVLKPLKPLRRWHVAARILFLRNVYWKSWNVSP